MDLFKESPEASNAFVFLKHYSTENEEFYDLLSKHALRVLGIITLLVKEVNNLRILQKKFLHHSSFYPFLIQLFIAIQISFHFNTNSNIFLPLLRKEKPLKRLSQFCLHT